MTRRVTLTREHAAFCAYLRRIRENFGYTQKDLAEAIGVSRPQYSALETGRSMLTFDHLCRISAHYRLELFELMAEKY